MTEIIRCGQCGNSPKALQGEDWVIAFEMADFEKVSSACGDSFFFIQGQLSRRLKELDFESPEFQPAEELTINMAISHGKYVVVSGVRIVRTERDSSRGAPYNGASVSSKKELPEQVGGDCVSTAFCYRLEYETASCRKLRQVTLYTSL